LLQQNLFYSNGKNNILVLRSANAVLPFIETILSFKSYFKRVAEIKKFSFTVFGKNILETYSLYSILLGNVS